MDPAKPVTPLMGRCHIGGEPPITRHMLRMIGMPFTLNISRARKELGYEPVVTWQSGIAAMGARISNPPFGVLA